MTTGPSQLDALNTGERAASMSSGETITLVEGSTFCLSNRVGDIRAGTAHGLFFRDARVISCWELRLDGQTPEPLAVLAPEAFVARFVLRRAPRAGLADSTVLMVRERLIADGLRETISIDNLGREATSVTLALHADGDFADLFAVKEGRAPLGGAGASIVDSELLLTDRSDGTRALSLSATADPVLAPGSLNWRAVVPAGRRWQTEIVAQPIVAHHRVSTRFERGQQPETSGPARKIEAWRSASTTMTADDPVLAGVLRRAESDLGILQIQEPTGNGRRYLAAGAPWFMTLFGRDSLLTAWMALPLDVGLALGTLEGLAELQGSRVDPVSEEEPGRIMHELRRGPASTGVLGGNRYYGSVDATPLFVMLLAECWRWGADEAAVRALLPAADAALAWIDRYGDRDGDGFVEYRRATDRGLINQGWKDSFDGITDAAGRIAEPPIALCEVQGYAYAARLARADLAEATGDPGAATTLRSAAAALRQRFAEAFWLAHRGWFALALDGRKQHVDALTSNTAHCLWTGIATDEQAAALIERLRCDEMDSGFGLRTLATSMAAYNPMSYHNGSVWPHDTAIAVAGLLRYAHLPGAVEAAQRLATGLLDAAACLGGGLPELFCGFARADFDRPVPYPTSCSPQGWASAAPLLLVRAFLGLQPDVPGRTLSVQPALPARFGTVALNDLRLGRVSADVVADGDTATVTGLPDGWRVTGGNTRRERGA